MFSRIRFITIVVASLMLGTCSTREPGDPLKPGYNVFSIDQDIELGKQAAGEIRSQVDVVKDEKLQSYVRNLGERLAAQGPAGEFPYEFTLINEKSINAFALPGGPIFIHSGLLDAAANENQLVGVLAHEVSHVALRHGTNQASKAQMIQLPAILAGAVIGQEGIWQQAAQIGVGLGLNALIMKYSRNAEKQADALGARIMAEAGFNPIGMAEFFQKLEEHGGSRPPALLSSHPSPGNRVKLVQAEMATFPEREYTYASGEFPNAKTAIAQLPEPKPPVQAQTVNAARGMAPSGPSTAGMRQVTMRTFSLQHPSDWEVYGGQSASVLTIAPRQGLVRTDNGGVAIGYGVVVSRFQPRFRTDLLNATYELIDEMQEMDPSLRAAFAPRQTQVQGSSALITGLRGSSPYGGLERVMVLSIARPEGLLYMVFIGPDRSFDRLEPTFNQMVSSIRFP